MAGAGGFEPPHGGIKIRCLTAWLRPNMSWPEDTVESTSDQPVLSAGSAEQRIQRPHGPFLASRLGGYDPRPISQRDGPGTGYGPEILQPIRWRLARIANALLIHWANEMILRIQRSMAIRAILPRSRSVAQSGSAPRSGRGGRRFKSCHSDQHLAEFSSRFATD
jgi:hypothetical protein